MLATAAGAHSLHGKGTSWQDRVPRRSASVPLSKQFSAVTHSETKQEFGTRIAKYISSYVRDGGSLSGHEFRQWQKYVRRDPVALCSALPEPGDSVSPLLRRHI